MKTAKLRVINTQRNSKITKKKHLKHTECCSNYRLQDRYVFEGIAEPIGPV